MEPENALSAAEDVRVADDVVDVPADLSGGSLTALGASLALAACGGGGGGQDTAGPPPPPAPPTVTLPNRIQAARFLNQASMGPTKGEIDKLTARGIDAWLNEQFALPRAQTHWDWLVAAGYQTAGDQGNTQGFDPVMWKFLISAPDTLRQRVGMALLDFLVIGVDGLNLPWRQFAGAAYIDILWDNAFGNFRTLLEKISTNAAMGSFLTFLGNRKANPNTGAVPDENYARELMQLFTIGLVKLNPDGSSQIGTGGRPAETYVQDDITGLARVFTGWNLDSNDNSTPDRLRRPMSNTANQHETGAKSFLGTSVPAGTNGAESLRLALDAIFAHPNVGPFVSRQLIQRLVTSNPPPAYVARVAAVFANNGSGVRGDLKAVVRAILTDTEARNEAIAGAPSYGKLREPVMRLTGWARAFNVTSPSDAWAIGNTSSTSNRLGQSPGRSPSVFNFFRPGYSPPNTPISNAGLVAPEFQITNEPSVIAYVNYMQGLVANGTGDVKPNYADMVAIADNSTNLVNEIDILLGAGLSETTRIAIRGAVDAISFTATNGPLNRVQTAVLLTLASPEFLVQK